jgi:uncharacterized protein
VKLWGAMHGRDRRLGADHDRTHGQAAVARAAAALDRPGRRVLLPTVETTLRAMDEAGVDIALLSAWYGPEGDLISNEEVSRQIAAAPTRFRGLAGADLRHPAAAVREIRRWVDGKTFVGVRVVPWLWDLPPNDRHYYPIYAAWI